MGSRSYPYSRETADVILERLANGGKRSALAHVLMDDDTLPCVTTWFKWLRTYPDLAEDYTRACEARAEVKHAEIEEIADTPVVGVTETDKLDKDGNEFTEVKRADMLGHRTLQIETRKWSASKLDPKKYTEKRAIEHSGTLGIKMEDATDDDLIAYILEMQATGRFKPPGGVVLDEGSDDDDDDPHGVG